MKKVFFSFIATLGLTYAGFAQNLQDILQKNNIRIEESGPAEPQPNSFTGTVTLQLQTSEKPGEQIQMTMRFKKWQTTVETTLDQTQSSRMIFDHQNHKMTVLLDGGGKGKSGKTGIVTKIPNLSVDAGQDNNAVKIEKTSEKKNILGYECTKWIITTDDGVAETWVTDAIRFNPFKAMGASMKNRSNQYIDQVDGFAMETVFVDNRNYTTTMKVTAIDTKEPDAVHFSTDGYQLMDMSNNVNFMNPGR